MTTTTTPDKIYSSLLTPAQIDILTRSVPNTDMKELRQKNQTYKYIKKEYLYDQLDTIFGPDGWDLSIDEVKIVNHEACEVARNQQKVPGVTVTAMARATINVKVDGKIVLSKSNIGAHTMRQSVDEIGGAFENALKSAVTDAFKRTAAMLGRRLGAGIENQEPEEMNVSEDANAPMTGNAPAAPKATAPAAAQATARPAAQPATQANAAPAASQTQPAPQARPAAASTQQTAKPAQAAPAASAPAATPAQVSVEEPVSTTQTESPSISPDAGEALADGNDEFAVHSKRTSDLIANIAGSNSEQLRIIAQHNFAAIKAATTEAQLRSCTAALTALLAYNASLAEPVGDLNKWVNYQIGQINKRLSGIEGAAIIEFNDLVPSA